MRKLLLLLLPFFLFPLPAAELRLTPNGSSFSSGMASFDAGSGRASFRSGILSYGDIGAAGIVRKISDPYSPRGSLKPEVQAPGKGSSMDGFVMEIGPLSLVLSSDERFLSGFFLSSDPFGIALLYAGRGKEDHGFHQDWTGNAEHEAYYAGLSFGTGLMHAEILASLAPETGTKAFASIGISHGRYSLILSAGGLNALHPDSTTSAFGIRGSFGRDGFTHEFSLEWGGVPVFSNEFRTFSASAASVLSIGDAKLYASADVSFTARGRRSHDEVFLLILPFISLGYETDGGFIAALDGGHFRAIYRRGEASVSFIIDIRTENAGISITVSSELEATLSLSLLL